MKGFRPLTIILLFFLLFIVRDIFSQITINERPTDSLSFTGRLFPCDSAHNYFYLDNNLFPLGSKRMTLDLNGEWNVFFGGSEPQKLIVPISYDFDGKVTFTRNFGIKQELLDNYSFLLVAEGISGENEIYINGKFITGSYNFSNSVIFEITEGTLAAMNELTILSENKPKINGTFPLSGQMNFSKVYGGITRDVYMIAVPKTYIIQSHLSYNAETSGIVKGKNTVSLKNFQSAQNFSVRTQIIRRSTGEVVFESSAAGLNSESIAVNDINLSGISLWSPQNPELYTVRTLLFQNDSLIDEHNAETGFRRLERKTEGIFFNGQPLKLNGIDYYQESPKYKSALDYRELEQDLRRIKELGFNAIRIPGASAHPYIVRLCTRLGLLLFQDFPFNGITEEAISYEGYYDKLQNSLRDYILRDRNSPAIFAYGLGNDFDVRSPLCLNYLTEAKKLVDSLDPRFTYYTTRYVEEDKCLGITDFRGINFYDADLNKIQSFITEISRPLNVKTSRSAIDFISAYCSAADNDNKSGYNDSRSVQSQAKFITDAYKLVQPVFFANFISSYADWHTPRPLINSLSSDHYLKTNGIFTYNREPKQAAEVVRRLITGGEIPAIQQGDPAKDSSAIFVIIGVITLVLLTWMMYSQRKFKDDFWRCLFRPYSFFIGVREQRLASTTIDITLSLIICMGIALFMAGVFYVRLNGNAFDLLTSNIIASDTLKIWFSSALKSPLIFIIVVTVSSFLLNFLTAVLIYCISFFVRGRIYFKNIYTAAVWSSLPLIICLPLGTVLHKLTANYPSFIEFALILFLIFYLLYLFRVVNAAKIMLELPLLKAYLWGTLVIVLLFGSLFIYLYSGRDTFELLSLIRNFR